MAANPRDSGFQMEEGESPNKKTRSVRLDSDVPKTRNSAPSSVVPSKRAVGSSLGLTRGTGQIRNADKEQLTVKTNGSKVKTISTITGNQLQNGQTFDFGDYELLDEIARGGMGIVFRAKQKGLNRIVALKVILAGQFASEEDVQRFQSEAEASAILQHRSIVPIYEVGQYEGRHFFSMGFVKGVTLSDMVRADPLLGREAAEIVAIVAGAVAFAHQHGVVHRDLKPGNILVDGSGQPHITDFGLAKRADTESELTGTGQVIGTPDYMAPEQASGLNHMTGPRSDIYSLGAVLYFALTGRAPFHAASMMKTLQQVIEEEPIPPSRLNASIDADLETICLKCLQKDPMARYQTAAELEADLQRYLNLEPIEARPIASAARVWRWCRRNRGTAILSGSLAALTVMLAILGPAFSIAQQRLIIRLTESKTNAKQSLKQANVAAIELNNTLVNSFVERGNVAIRSSEPIAALPWYAKALQQDTGTQASDWSHRVRIASILQQAPEPIAMWKMSSETSMAALSPDGRMIAAIGVDGMMTVWSLDSLQRILGPVRLGLASPSTLDFLADGRSLLHTSGSLLQIWNLDTRTETFTTQKLGEGIRTATVDMMDGTLVVGLRNGVVQTHDPKTGEIRRILGRHEAVVQMVCIHSKTARVLSCSKDGTAMLFDLVTGDILQVLEHEQAINWAEFDATGELIVTASDDATAQVWRTSDGEPVGPPIRCDDRVRVARFDHSGSKVATGSWASKARVWDSQDGKELVEPMLHENSIPYLEFSEDDRSLLTSSLDHTARVWDSRTGEMRCPPLLHGYLVVKSFFLPDSRVVTAGADKLIRVWKYKTNALQECSVKGQEKITAAALSPDSSFFVIGESNGVIRVWDSNTKDSRGFTLEHDAEISDIDVSFDGRRIVAASLDGTVQIWNALSGNPIGPRLVHHSTRGQVQGVSFHPDGQQVLTFSEDGTARVWDATTGEQVFELEFPRSLTYASYSSDGSMIVTCCRDRTTRVWNGRDGTPISPPLKHRGVVEFAAFSPDRQWLATCSRDHSAIIWNAVTWQRQAPSLQHSAGVVSAEFSLDSQQLVTGARDGTAKIWKVSNGSQIGSPLIVGRGLIRATYSPCGRYIATAGGHSAQLWDARDGKSLGAPLKHSNWVDSAQFSADSKWLLSRSSDETSLWKVPEPPKCSKQRLIDLSHLVSGHRAANNQTLVAIPANELQTLLYGLMSKKAAVSDETSDSSSVVAPL